MIGVVATSAALTTVHGSSPESESILALDVLPLIVVQASCLLLWECCSPRGALAPGGT